MPFNLSFVLPVIQRYEHIYSSLRSTSAINSATESWEDLHTETMTCLPQIKTYVIVGKETGHKGGP